MADPIKKHKIVNGFILESINNEPYKAMKNADGSFMKATADQQKKFDEQVAKDKKVKEAQDAATQPAAGNTGVVNRINKVANANNATGEVPLLIEPYAYGSKTTPRASKYDRDQWRKWAKETGFKPTKRTVAEQNKEFQLYLLQDDKFKDKVKAIHEELGMPYAGQPDDQYLGERWDRIMEKLTAPKEEEPVVPPAPEEDKVITKKDDKVVEDEERKPFETNTPTNYNLPENGPWWLQDIIKTAGAAGDLARIKKYLPWQANPQVRLPDATFYDPTRELAANTEQANLAYQTQSAFTNPQQLAAASSVTQGQAAKNAADIMGRYNNLNVGLANQLSQERTGILNTASQNKANLDTQLWDKYTIANQQFDNSRAKARENLRSSYIDAITNRANTANLNSLYPEYNVDPSSGGFIHFNPNAAKIKATDKYDYMDALHKKAIQYSNDPIMQERYFRDMLSKGAGDSTDEDEYYNRLKKVNSRGYNKSNQTEETEE